MKKNQKLIVYGAGGLLALVLLYRWYQNKQAAATAAATTTPTDQAASDYASLAGQEQADVAALNGQLSTIQSALSASPTQANLPGTGKQGPGPPWNPGGIKPSTGGSGKPTNPSPPWTPGGVKPDLVPLGDIVPLAAGAIPGTRQPPPQPPAQPTPIPIINPRRPSYGAGHAIAPTTHEPKPATIRRALPGSGPHKPS